MKILNKNDGIEIISYALLTISTCFFSHATLVDGPKEAISFEVIDNKYLISIILLMFSALLFYGFKPKEAFKEMIKCTLISSSTIIINLLHFNEAIKDDIISLISQISIQLVTLVYIKNVSKTVKLCGIKYGIAEAIGFMLIITPALYIKNFLIISIVIIVFFGLDFWVGYKFFLKYEQKTILFYDKNAEFINKKPRTSNRYIDEFLSKIVRNGRILDFGAGTGDDSKYFIEKGFRVDALDGSSEMCKIINEKIKNSKSKCITCKFTKFNTKEKYKGIWANYSLDHLRQYDIKRVIKKLYNALDDAGTLYCSFKKGKKDELIDGLYYNKEYSEKEVTKLFDSCDGEKEILSENDTIHFILRKQK